ncbi:ester cyclase [Edaphobacter paludis]|uniref:Ester cyclase n=1 Tax=Edaphobacter paludis TaxID=3035702 RepID=A0AAU7D7C3_9BACT
MSSHNKQPPDNKQIVRRFMDECWSHGKLDSIHELVADKCRFHDPVFPSLTSGAENIKAHIETCRRGFPDLKFAIDDTIAERNEVVIHWTARGTHTGTFLGMPPTNRKATVSGTSIFRIENSRITETWAHWNLMSMMEQLGVTMAPQVESSKAESRINA